jgi:hypothetical protein
VRKLKRVLPEFFKTLNIFTIWIILPSIVFISIVKYPGRQFLEFGNALLLAFVVLGVCFVSTVVLSYITKENRKTTIALVLNSSFMNVVYIGFPVVYAVLGPEFLGPAALYAMGIGIPHLILGTTLASLAAKRRITLRLVAMSILTFPAAFALIAALLFVGFQAHIPPIIPNAFDKYVAPFFFIIMLSVVGFQIPLVNPRRYTKQLVSVGAFRFIVAPIITYLMILAFGLSLGDAPVPSSAPPAFLLSAMPPALFNVILAHTFGLDTKLYGALVFYLTWVSLLLVLPIMHFFIF